MSRNPGRPWRVQSDDRGDFDELCVGAWLHVERLTHRDFHLVIGARRFNVNVKKDGSVETWEVTE